MDFKEYVLISNEKQIIENLSRIRVKNKEKLNQLNNDLNIEEKVKLMSLLDNEFESQSIQNSMFSSENLIDFDSNLLENNFKDFCSEKKEMFKNCFISNNLVKEKSVNKEKVDINEELISDSTDETIFESLESESVGNSSQPLIGCSQQNHSKAINYLNLKLSSYYIFSSNSRIMSYKTFVKEIHKNTVIGMSFYFLDYKAFRKLLDLMIINRRCFQTNQKNGSIKWQIISDQMISNGFKDWNPNKCRDAFLNGIELYKKVSIIQSFVVINIEF